MDTTDRPLEGLTRRRFLGGVVLSGAALALLDACTPTSASGGGGSRQDTLVLSVADTINQLSDTSAVNPYLLGTNRTGWQFAFEPLFFYNPWWTDAVSAPPWITDAKDGLVPYLATDYAYNDGYDQIDIHLRKGVSWSDGQPFTADDVVFTLQMLKQNAPALTFSYDINLWVKDVQAVDDHTVHIDLSGRNPRFMSGYLIWYGDVGIPIVPAHIWKSQDMTSFTNFDLAKGWPITTGPWKLTDSTAEQKVWTRRDDWWGAKTGFHRLPAMKRIVVLPLYSNDKLTQLLTSNQVDATHNIPPANAKTALAQNSKLIVRTSDKSGLWGWPDFWVNQLGFNCSKAPYDDPDIRKAINYAIDRDQLVSRGFANQTTKNTMVIPPFHSLQKYRDMMADSIAAKEIDAPSVDKCAAIMTAKGYAKNGSGVWTKDGQPFSIVILTRPGYFENYMPLLTQQLRAAGFDAGYKELATETSQINLGEADAYLEGDFANPTMDPWNELTTFSSQYSAPTGKIAQYPYRWSNPQYDQLMAQMAALPTTDPQYDGLFTQAYEILLDELPVIPLLDNNLLMPVNTTYWKGWPTADNPYTSPSGWHRGDATLLINTLERA